MALKSTTAQANAVDRLAALYQQARLHTRRQQRCVAEAEEARNAASLGAATARLRAAEAWEARTCQRYLRAAVLEYAWWHLPTEGARSDVPARLAAA